MPDDAIYIDSLGKTFICSPERILYTYYSRAIDHSIEEDTSSRDKVQDEINPETVVSKSRRKRNSLTPLMHLHASMEGTQKVLRMVNPYSGPIFSLQNCES